MSLYYQFLVCYSVPKAYPLLIIITSTVHTLSLVCDKRSVAGLVILAQVIYRSSNNSVDIVCRFISCAPKIFFHTCRLPVITSGESWRVWMMSQHLPTPALYQILHIRMVLRWSIILEQMTPCSSSSGCFVVNSRPHFMLQDCSVILAID